MKVTKIQLLSFPGFIPTILSFDVCCHVCRLCSKILWTWDTYFLKLFLCLKAMHWLTESIY